MNKIFINKSLIKPNNFSYINTRPKIFVRKDFY